MLIQLWITSKSYLKIHFVHALQQFNLHTVARGMRIRVPMRLLKEQMRKDFKGDCICMYYRFQGSAANVLV